jgi:hypothetical protein
MLERLDQSCGMINYSCVKQAEAYSCYVLVLKWLIPSHRGESVFNTSLHSGLAQVELGCSQNPPPVCANTFGSSHICRASVRKHFSTAVSTWILTNGRPHALEHMPWAPERAACGVLAGLFGE